MCERAESFGGSFAAESVQGSGTTITVRVPLRRDRDEVLARGAAVVGGGE
jgi:hypothetical protein